MRELNSEQMAFVKSDPGFHFGHAAYSARQAAGEHREGWALESVLFVVDALSDLFRGSDDVVYRGLVRAVGLLETGSSGPTDRARSFFRDASIEIIRAWKVWRADP